MVTSDISKSATCGMVLNEGRDYMFVFQVNTPDPCSMPSDLIAPSSIDPCARIVYQTPFIVTETALYLPPLILLLFRTMDLL